LKRNRHGRGKILTQQEIQLLFTSGLQTTLYRCLFATALFSAARINEVCTLVTEDIPIRVIAAYSGHRDLAQLNAYLEVRDEQVLGAAASLSMLSPVMGDVGNVTEDDIPHNTPQAYPTARTKKHPPKKS